MYDIKIINNYNRLSCKKIKKLFQAPQGYTAEQWAAAQQQNWAQWQQWQQQYQQWQAQYGEKVNKILYQCIKDFVINYHLNINLIFQYQETMKQYGQAQQAPPLPAATQPPPPPPKDDKPPPPPTSAASTAYGYSTTAPPVSNKINFKNKMFLSFKVFTQKNSEQLRT